MNALPTRWSGGPSGAEFPLEPFLLTEEHAASWHIRFWFVKEDTFKWEYVMQGELLVFSQQAHSYHPQYENTADVHLWFCHHYNENRH